MDYAPWGCKELDTTEQLTHMHLISQGLFPCLWNGGALKWYCLLSCDSASAQWYLSGVSPTTCPFTTRAILGTALQMGEGSCSLVPCSPPPLPDHLGKTTGCVWREKRAWLCHPLPVLTWKALLSLGLRSICDIPFCL